MADYQKKNVKRLKAKKPVKSTVDKNYKLRAFDEAPIAEDIPVKTSSQARKERKAKKQKDRYLKREQPQKRIVNPSRSARELNQSPSSLRILSGTKKIKLTKNIIALSLIVTIIATISTVHFFSPTGFSELISNGFAKTGSGTGFPITLSGGTVKEMHKVDDNIAVLSDTYLEVYNSESKELISEQHGFSNPAISVSDARILAFDRASKDLKVYNFSGNLFEREMKDDIVTAALGRNGTYCVITDPENCAAKLNVYNKDNTALFSYESESELIGQTSVSESGKTVAIGTINADGGEYKSKILIFNSKDGKKVFEKEFNEVVYSISGFSSGYVVCTASGLMKLDEKSGADEKLGEGTVVYNCSPQSFGYLAAFGIKDSDDNLRAEMFNKKFEKEATCPLETLPSQMAYNDKYIAYSKDNHIYVLDYQGNLVKNINSGFFAEDFVIINDSIYLVNNSVLQRINITEYAEDNK